MKRLQLLTCVIIAALLIVSLTAVSASATTVSPFTLSSSAGQLQYDLPAGTVFNGSISTTGTVRFWVNAPNGAQIVNLGLIDEYASFGFVAQQSGNYTLNFENSLPDSVQVIFSYVTDPDISGNADAAQTVPNYTLILVLAVVAVVGSILIIFFIRRKNKKLNAQ
jgi:hypothetical protein